MSVRTEEPVTKDADFGAVVSRASDYLPAERLDAIREAYEYAAICHEGQLRKTGDPYITHPVSVAYMVANLELDHQAIIAALRTRFPLIQGPRKSDICYATQNRQDAVKLMSPQVDIMIVVGSPTSSNSNRLAELARKLGVSAYMVDSASELQTQWFEGKSRVGLTAGASAPEVLVTAVIDRIKALGAVSVRKMDGIEETVKFPLPKGLRLDA